MDQTVERRNGTEDLYEKASKNINELGRQNEKAKTKLEVFMNNQNSTNEILIS